jgi:eukaryotic-like serine/threonine-protein kinase
MKTKQTTSFYLVFLLMLFVMSCDKDVVPSNNNSNNNSGTTTTKSSAKDITKFSFAALSPGVEAIVDATNKTISLTVPSNTDVTKLVPTIAISDKATVSPATSVSQDFSKEVSYTVTAEDGSTATYKVNVKKVAEDGNSGTLSSTDQLVYVGKSVFSEKLNGNATYTISGTSFIVAMDAITGKELSTWKMGETLKIGDGAETYTPSSLGGGKPGSNIVYYNNNTLFTRSDKFEARDAFTGKLKWSKDITPIDYITSKNTVAANGVIYIVDGLTVLALDEATGAEKWKKTMDQNTFKKLSTLTVSSNLMYISTDTGLLCLEIATGNEKWKLIKQELLSQNRISSNPTVANGTVYYGGFDAKKLYAVDAFTGKLKWESALASYGGMSPTVSEGIIYMSCYCGTLYAFDETTGALKWQQKLGGEYLGSPLADVNNVYISDYDTKKTFVLDKKTGTKKIEISTKDRVEHTILAGDLIYLRGEVFDAKTGTKKWEIPKIPYSNGVATSYSYPDFIILKNKYYASGNSGMVQ